MGECSIFFNALQANLRRKCATFSSSLFRPFLKILLLSSSPPSLELHVLEGVLQRPERHLVEGDERDPEEHAQASADLPDQVVQLVEPGLPGHPLVGGAEREGDAGDAGAAEKGRHVRVGERADRRIEVLKRAKRKKTEKELCF